MSAFNDLTFIVYKKKKKIFPLKIEALRELI